MHPDIKNPDSSDHSEDQIDITPLEIDAAQKRRLEKDVAEAREIVANTIPETCDLYKNLHTHVEASHEACQAINDATSTTKKMAEQWILIESDAYTAYQRRRTLVLDLVANV